MAQLPEPGDRHLSYEFRTLGLGYANLGTVLMRLGIPYARRRPTRSRRRPVRDPDRRGLRDVGRDGQGARCVPGLRAQPRAMLRVMRNHRRAAYNASASRVRGPQHHAGRHRPQSARPYLLEAARECWDRALELGEKHGYPQRADHLHRADRHDRAADGLRHHRRRARLRAGQVQEARRRRLLQDRQPEPAPALRSSATTDAADRRDPAYVVGRKTLAGCPASTTRRCATAASTTRPCRSIEKALRRRVRHLDRLQQGHPRRGVPEETRHHRGPDGGDWSFDLLKHLGFTKADIQAANDYVCGTMTLEGAPHLKDVHLPVFDCANRCGRGASATSPTTPTCT
jgi:ribonucleoside-diphosphate reductase alpha chain